MKCGHVAQLQELIDNLKEQNHSLLMIVGLFRRLEAKVLRLELMLLSDEIAEEGENRGRS